MMAIILAIGSSLAAVVGMEAYDYMTYEDRVNTCVARTVEANPKINFDKIRIACETVTK